MRGSSYRPAPDGYEVTEHTFHGPLHREVASCLGLKVAGFGLVKGPLELVRKKRNSSGLLLPVELMYIMRQRLLKDRKCTLATRVVMAMIGAGISAYSDYSSQLNPYNPFFNLGLLPPNLNINLSLFATSMLVNAPLSGWVFSEVAEQLSWKLKIRVRGPLRGINCGERLGVTAIFLLSLAGGILNIVQGISNKAQVGFIVRTSISAVFYSLFSYGWLLSRLLERRGAANAESMALVTKMQVLARNKEALTLISSTNWESGEDFLKAIIEREQAQIPPALAPLHVARRVVSGLVAAIAFAIYLAEFSTSNNSINSTNVSNPRHSTINWSTFILSSMAGSVINFVVTSAFIQAIANTFCARSKRSLIEQFFPRLLAGMSIPFFLVAFSAGLFLMMNTYPSSQEKLELAGYGSEDKVTTGPPSPEFSNGPYEAGAVLSGVLIFLRGAFAFREWFKILLRCSVAAKHGTHEKSPLNLSLNFLSAGNHIQSMSPDDVAEAVSYCRTRQ